MLAGDVMKLVVEAPPKLKPYQGPAEEPFCG